MSNAWHCLSIFLISFSNLEDNLYSDIFHYECTSLRASWIILNCLLYIKQHLILLIIPGNLRNLLVKNTFPLNNVVGGQVRNAVNYFLWILTSLSLCLINAMLLQGIFYSPQIRWRMHYKKKSIEQNCPKFSKNFKFLKIILT